MLTIPENSFIIEIPPSSNNKNIIYFNDDKKAWEFSNINLLYNLGYFKFGFNDLGKILTETEVIEKYQRGGIEEVLKIFNFRKKPFRGNKNMIKTAIKKEIDRIKINNEW
jgi:hypothetical protein